MKEAGRAGAPGKGYERKSGARKKFFRRKRLTPSISPGGKIEGASISFSDQRGRTLKIVVLKDRTHGRHSLFPGALAVASVENSFEFSVFSFQPIRFRVFNPPAEN